MFHENGYDHEQIFYISTQSFADVDGDGINDIDATATKTTLQAAITTWADQYVGTNKPLNIYLMDHGDYDKFYLDKLRGEIVRPDELNGWIELLESNHPGLLVNIIIEMCNAGSFIDGPTSLSAPNRVVIASTASHNLAYASDNGGATFSDHFIPALAQHLSLATSFDAGVAAVASARHIQVPWIDADGDKVPNQPNDHAQASLRGFGFPGTFPGSLWPPYIKIHEPVTLDDGYGDIIVEILDDETNSINGLPHAVIYAPSYTPPPTGDELTAEILPTVSLHNLGNKRWGGQFSDFTEPGVYQVVVYAEDLDRLQARPYSFNVIVGGVEGVVLSVKTSSTYYTTTKAVFYVMIGMFCLISVTAYITTKTVNLKRAIDAP